MGFGSDEGKVSSILLPLPPQYEKEPNMWTQKGDEDVSFLKTMRRREGGRETGWVSRQKTLMITSLPQLCFIVAEVERGAMKQLTRVAGGPICPYTFIKVPKHLTYIQYGSVIQSEAFCGLNNDITKSHLLRSPSKTPKSTPDLQRRIAVRVVPYAHKQHIKVPKHLYTSNMMWNPV